MLLSLVRAQVGPRSGTKNLSVSWGFFVKQTWAGSPACPPLEEWDHIKQKTRANRRGFFHSGRKPSLLELSNRNEKSELRSKAMFSTRLRPAGLQVRLLSGPCVLRTNPGTISGINHLNRLTKPTLRLAPHCQRSTGPFASVRPSLVHSLCE